MTSLSDSSIDIVLLHGANGCRSEVDPWCQALAALGLYTHAVNLAGHGGRAVPTQMTMDTFTQDLLEQLDQLNLRQPILFGYSFVSWWRCT